MKMSSKLYKRQIPVAIMILITLIMVSEYYIQPLDAPLSSTVTMLSGWGSIIASFTTIMALFSLLRYYYTQVTGSGSTRDKALAWYGLAIVIITLLLGSVIYHPSHGSYMALYFDVMLPLFFASMGLNGFILISALYSGFRVRNVSSAAMLIMCLITLICATPILVSTWPVLGDTYIWLNSVPVGAATKAFNIAVGIGMVGIALRTLTGAEKSLFGGGEG
jgi:hypothetical protein